MRIYHQKHNLYYYKWQELKGINFLYRKGQKLENYFIGDGKVYTDQEANKVVKLKLKVKYNFS